MSTVRNSAALAEILNQHSPLQDLEMHLAVADVRADVPFLLDLYLEFSPALILGGEIVFPST